MRRHLLVVSSLALVLTASACGGGGGADPVTKASPTTSASGPTSPGASPTPSPSASPTGLPAGTRVALEVTPADQAQVPKGGCRPDRRAGLVCSADGKQGYRFQPSAVRRAGVTAVGARQVQPGDWAVDITLGPAGTTALAAVTREAARTRQLVVVMVPATRRVLVAAQVTSPITDGNVQVSGGFTEARAQRIVRQITRTGA